MPTAPSPREGRARKGYFGALAVLAALTSACGSSPEPTFYALAPTQGVIQKAAPHAIRVRRPSLAGYLDRPEVVRGVVDYRLGVAPNERWGEPLDAMLGRILAEDIEARCPGTSVFTEDGAITADPDATVEVDIRRFDRGEDGQAHLDAEIALDRKGNPTVTQSIRLVEPVSEPTTAHVVATMSHLLGQLADQIAASLTK